LPFEKGKGKKRSKSENKKRETMGVSTERNEINKERRVAEKHSKVWEVVFLNESVKLK